MKSMLNVVLINKLNLNILGLSFIVFLSFYHMFSLVYDLRLVLI